MTVIDKEALFTAVLNDEAGWQSSVNSSWGCLIDDDKKRIRVLATGRGTGGGGGGGSGDVEGPASSTDNAVVRFNGTGGKDIQNSVVIVDDSGNISGFVTLTAGNGGGMRTTTTSGHAVVFQAYDNDGALYRTFITLTAGNIPSLTINVPTGGSGTMNGVVIGGANPVAATFADTAVLGELSVTSNDTTLIRLENASGFSTYIKSNGISQDVDLEVPDGPGVLSVKMEAPAAVTDPGFEGAWAEDSDFIYAWCVTVGEWRRTSLAAW